MSDADELGLPAHAFDRQDEGADLAALIDERQFEQEREVVIGELDGPVGTALATLLGDQVKGHTRVFAILNSDVQVKPATLETGLVVSVPSFVNEGDKIRVNTESGEYQSRV